MTQGIHRVVSVVTHSHPADAGPCTKGGTSLPYLPPAPMASSSQWQVWALWTARTLRKRFILTTVS